MVHPRQLQCCQDIKHLIINLCELTQGDPNAGKMLDTPLWTFVNVIVTPSVALAWLCSPCFVKKNQTNLCCMYCKLWQDLKLWTTNKLKDWNYVILLHNYENLCVLCLTNNFSHISFYACLICHSHHSYHELYIFTKLCTNKLTFFQFLILSLFY